MFSKYKYYLICAMLHDYKYLFFCYKRDAKSQYQIKLKYTHSNYKPLVKSCNIKPKNIFNKKLC